MSPPPGRPKEGSFPPGGTAQSAQGAPISPPPGRPKEGSLPLGGTARSAEGAPISPPPGRPKEGSLPLGGTAQSALGAPDGALLVVDSLDMAYAGRRGQPPVQVLRSVSFNLAAGETLGIVGESGSGKSTLAAALVRLLAPGGRILAGSIRFEDQDLLKLSERAMRDVRGSRIATILQDPLNSLNPLMSIGDQVAEAPRVHGVASKSQAWERARALISAVRIASPDERLREFPHQLSGGMRQRVAGAIALSCAPRLLIADEPTTALDPTVQIQYLQLLKDLQREHGFALILITHDLGVVGRVCDRIAVMYAGRLVEQGPTLATLREPRHPYTAALLASLPRLPAVPGTLRTIPGQPPDPAHPPSGCPFHPRCPQAMDRCGRDLPPTLQLSPGREAACWLNGP